eukprot:CAMPEP_0176499522 /NCGR_PEP_ID=MMETSP0200_2-20121128/12975_1 /TAXON_ID=947934 /ORGANISM="Chaetoceros sp., Strain GSL56" /LENGTH=632 /DNA_ID=CAMNT_0017897953 /DNA_START=23 /DNA_END=1924 /DNA_ORIENTATION=-
MPAMEVIHKWFTLRNSSSSSERRSALYFLDHQHHPRHVDVVGGDDDDQQQEESRNNTASRRGKKQQISSMITKNTNSCCATRPNATRLLVNIILLLALLVMMSNNNTRFLLMNYRWVVTNSTIITTMKNKENPMIMTKNDVDDVLLPPLPTNVIGRTNKNAKEKYNISENNDEHQQGTNHFSPPQILHFLKAATELEDGLPTFLIQYLKWHNAMRQKFPGRQIMQHPEAPNIIIRYTNGPSSLENGGGLYDRLAANFLGDFLWACANRRVLLYLWHHPRPLTDFLAPNHMDWTVPQNGGGGVLELDEDDGDSTTAPTSTNSTRKQRNFIITHRVNDDTLANTKIILYNSPRGLVDVHWEKYNATVPLPIAFSKLWNYMFKPNDYVAKILNQFWDEHPPGMYSASHIRLLHPSFYDFKNAKVSGWIEDEQLPWTFETMKVTLPPTIHALRCAATAQENMTNTTSGIYLFSDWITIVQQLQEVSHNNSIHTAAAVEVGEGIDSFLNTWVAEKMKHIYLLDNILLLEHGGEVAHLKTPNQTMQAYASSFIDIYIAAAAKCLSYGLGRFGYLASLIGGHSCLNRHQHPNEYNIKRWNMWESVKGAPLCTVSPEYPKGIDPDEVFNGAWSHASKVNL